MTRKSIQKFKWPWERKELSKWNKKQLPYFERAFIEANKTSFLEGESPTVIVLAWFDGLNNSDQYLHWPAKVSKSVITSSYESVLSLVLSLLLLLLFLL